MQSWLFIALALLGSFAVANAASSQDAGSPAPVAEPPAVAPAGAQEPVAPAAPAVEAAPAPATDAPALVAPEPAPPAPQEAPPPPSQPQEPARSALRPPPVTESWPQEAPVRAPYDRSYRGLSIRLTAQLGLASATRDLDAERTRISGLGGGATLDVGTAAADDLVVYGRVGGFALNHASSSDTPNAGSAYFGLLGGGVRYHYMPYDWYGSATLALALASTTNDLGVVENAKPGIGAQLELGKNWVSGPDAEWATVGVGLRFSYVRCGSLKDIDEPWIGTALSFVFSLAYDAPPAR